MNEKLKDKRNYILSRNENIFDQINFSFSFIDKYLKDEKKIIGILTGNYLKEKLDISYDEKNKVHVLSNKVKEKTIIKKDNYLFEIIPSKHNINNFNYEIIQFLDLFNYLNFEEVMAHKEKIIDYIYKNEFTSLMRNKYFNICLNEGISNLINSNIFYEFIEVDE